MELIVLDIQNRKFLIAPTDATSQWGEPDMSTENSSANIWEEWVPESALADVLAGRDVVADIGQVSGLWKRTLEKEVRAGRLVKWKGHWFPQAGAPYGIGPLKACYGLPAIRDAYASFALSKAAT